MDFQEQVMGLTELTIDASSTIPRRAELSQFLKDGVMEVTRRCIESYPAEIDLFARKSSIIGSNSSLNLNGARIISVMREAAADGSSDGSTAWRECRKIPLSLQSRVADPESLYFASKYNPVYTVEENGLINVYPVPDGGTANGFRVHYVNNEPVNDSGSALAYNHSTIKYFPADKVYLVVLYAAIKSIEGKLSSYTIVDEDIELVQGLNASLAVLAAEFASAFPPPMQQQGRDRTRTNRTRREPRRGGRGG